MYCIYVYAFIWTLIHNCRKLCFLTTTALVGFGEVPRDQCCNSTKRGGSLPGDRRRALKQEHTEDPMSRWPVAWNLKQRNPWFSGFLLCPVWQSVEPSLNMCLDVSLRLIIFALLLVFYFIRKILPRTSKLDSFNLDVGFSFDLNGEPCPYVVQHLSWQAAPNLCANLVLDMSFFHFHHYLIIWKMSKKRWCMICLKRMPVCVYMYMYIYLYTYHIR